MNRDFSDALIVAIALFAFAVFAAHVVHAPAKYPESLPGDYAAGL